MDFPGIDTFPGLFAVDTSVTITYVLGQNLELGLAEKWPSAELWVH